MLQMVTNWVITECTPEGLDGKYTAIDQVSIEEEKDGYLETVFEDGILKKEYSLEEIRQRIDNGL